MRKLIIPALLVSVVIPAYSAMAADDDLHVSKTQTVEPSDNGASYTTDSRYDSSWSDSGAVKKQEAGTVGDDSALQSTAEASKMKGGLMDEVVGIKPQVGVLNYRDVGGRVGNRGTVGFTAEMNAASTVANITGMDGLKTLYLGPSTGFFYSHLGSTGSNFWGTDGNDSAGLGSAGSNLFFVPVNAKIGTNIGPFRFAVHGGANLFYRSVANTIALGVSPDTNTDSSWSFLPNVGADIELGATNAIALILRPDLTFGGSNRVWSASLGASIPLG
jgi:hypothetical protein